MELGDIVRAAEKVDAIEKDSQPNLLEIDFKPLIVVRLSWHKFLVNWFLSTSLIIVGFVIYCCILLTLQTP